MNLEQQGVLQHQRTIMAISVIAVIRIIQRFFTFIQVPFCHILDAKVLQNERKTKGIYYKLFVKSSNNLRFVTFWLLFWRKLTQKSLQNNQFAIKLKVVKITYVFRHKFVTTRERFSCSSTTTSRASSTPRATHPTGGMRTSWR